MRKMADAAWICGDPGMQYDTTINDWHPCINTARINASNPCSEYMFLDDSACNLASLNLRKFQQPAAAGELDVEAFRRAIQTTITAMEIIVDNAKYPTEKIAENSLRVPPARPRLREPRRAPHVARPAVRLRTPDAPTPPRSPRSCAATRMRRRRRSRATPPARSPATRTTSRSSRSWRSTAVTSTRSTPRWCPTSWSPPRATRGTTRSSSAEKYGFRNGQATVLAPTGTIAFLMDCDTTGIEPDIALVKYKRLVGGGLLKIVNHTVPEALTKLGYTDDEVEAIIAHIDANDTIEGAPHLKDEHLPVFDCAFRALERHALDPLHGPHPHDGGGPAVPLGRDLQDGQPADRLHGRGHRGRVHPGVEARPQGDRGLSRRLQAHPAAVDQHEEDQRRRHARCGGARARRRLGLEPSGSSPEERSSRWRRCAPQGAPVRCRWRTATSCPTSARSFTHKFSIGGHEGYITVGLYEDGTPGRDLRAHGQGGLDHRRA